MKFFIDSAHIDEIKKAHTLGLLDGVTTNPSLVAKTGRPFLQVVEEICEFVKGPVSVECTTTTARDMIHEGRKFAKIRENVVVKIPMTEEGLAAASVFSSENIRTNVTLVFTAAQALLAAKVGATFVSPFVGRLDDVATSGMDLVRDIKRIYENYHFSTEILVASIRNPIHVVESALAGAHVGTMPLSVMTQLFKHPLTDIGLAKFLEDWKKAQL